ncbi:hypothetical protein KVT40_008698 [Elsinoe batatas]|uniref:Uncharacterized protein n=1 Tax=Elsinoe batatas TaxID=2601811 RepID=A0A8K0KV02_9PEZI|nr:hypothetical protein KVT40_008698 [Elsinoe batatas]
MAPPTYQNHSNPTTTYDELFTASGSSQDTRPPSMQQTTLASVHAMMRDQEMYAYHTMQHADCAPPRARRDKRKGSPSRRRGHTTISTNSNNDQSSPSAAPLVGLGTQSYQNAMSISSDESRSVQESDDTPTSTQPSYAQESEEGRPSKKVKIERAGAGADSAIEAEWTTDRQGQSPGLIERRIGEDQADPATESSALQIKVEKQHQREVSEADSWPDYIPAVKPEPFTRDYQESWVEQSQHQVRLDHASDAGSANMGNDTAWQQEVPDDFPARTESPQIHYADAATQLDDLAPAAARASEEDYLTPAARELSDGFMRQYNLIVAEREEREAREAQQAQQEHIWTQPLIADHAHLPEHLHEPLPPHLPQYLPEDIQAPIPAAIPEPLPDAIPDAIPDDAVLSDADLEAIQYEARIELLNRDLDLAREGLELGRRIIGGLQRDRARLQRDVGRLVEEREGWLRERERLIGEVREARAGEEAAEAKYEAAKMLMRARGRRG